MVLDTFLNPVLGPLLTLPPFVGLFLIALFISLIVTIVYKYTTNQVVMKGLRDDIKSHQKKMKELRHDPSKMMESQKKAMEANMQYMMHSLKPTLFTLIPILIIFGWLSAHFTYSPLQVQEQFNITAHFKEGVNGTVELLVPTPLELQSEKVQQVSPRTTWILIPKEEGKFTIELKFQDRYYQKDILITDTLRYEPVQKEIDDVMLESIELGNKRSRPLGNFYIPWFTGPWYPGWLALYLFFSIAFSLGLKRAFNLY